MRYINKKTGAIIDSPSKIISKKWRKVEEIEGLDEIDEIDEVDEVDETEEELDEEEVEEFKSFGEISIEQIKKELDFLGIEYNSKAKKQELYDLMIQGR